MENCRNYFRGLKFETFGGGKMVFQMPATGGKQEGAQETLQSALSVETKDLNREDFDKKYNLVRDYFLGEKKNADEKQPPDIDLSAKAAKGLADLDDIHKKNIEMVGEITKDKAEILKTTLQQVARVVDEFFQGDKPVTPNVLDQKGIEPLFAGANPTNASKAGPIH